MVGSRVIERLSIDPFLLRAQSGVLLDVRAPVEFEHGHIPNAISWPLFTDEERAHIGTLYKQAGREKATLEGLRFVGPRLEELAQSLIAHSQKGPLCFYCARGGMRSGAVVWLANLLQLNVCVLEGGYRSYRQWLEQLWTKPWPLRILGGLTGVGKTQLLHALRECGAQVIDLEGLANHKGSAFGGVLEAPQPSQSQFENELGYQLHALDFNRPIWIEDESRLIGHRAIPPDFWAHMRVCPVLYISRPLSYRVELLKALYGEADSEILLQCTEKIKRRLGPQKLAIAQAAIQHDDLSTAIQLVLEYYDQTYKHGLSKRNKVKHLDLNALEGQEAAQTLERIWGEVWGHEDKPRPAL